MKTMFRFAAIAAVACCAMQAHAQRTVLLVRHAELQGQAMAQAGRDAAVRSRRGEGAAAGPDAPAGRHHGRY